MRYRILTPGEASPKLRKLHGVESAICYLAPHALHGVTSARLARLPLAHAELGTGVDARGRLTVCVDSTVACRALCMFTSGRGRFDTVRQARLRRTRLLLTDPARFHAMLDADLARLAARAHRLGVPAVARLNGTSDLTWTRTYRAHPRVGFYEYTKRADVVRRFLARQTPRNLLAVVYSRTETNEAEALALRAAGASIAVVFSTRPREALPRVWRGLPVVDGDATDARYMDAPGSVIGLRAKGRARRDRSGFVVQV